MRTVEIDGLIFEIKEIPGLKDGGDVINGSVNHDELLIKLGAEMPKQSKEEVLLHEVLHVLDHTRQLGFKEQQIESLSHGLYALGFRVPTVTV